MTNYEFLISTPKDELAKWLDKHSVIEDTPWSKWFDEKYCQKCEVIECKVINVNRFDTTVKCSYCELEGKCKFFQELDEVPSSQKTIEMWLDEIKEIG